MKVLIFIIVVGIASVVFYLFLRKAFEQRLDEVKDESGQVKIKPLLPEEVKKDEVLEQDSSAKEDELQQHQSKAEGNSCGSGIICEQYNEEKE